MNATAGFGKIPARCKSAAAAVASGKMPPTPKPYVCQWLSSGEEIFPALLAAIESAQKTIRLEIYIYAGDELGKAFRAALMQALHRGVRVRVLIDALGSLALPANFWQPLLAAGGEVRWFNPMLHKRFGLRNHRKLLACDDEVAFVGGFNIAIQYQGDGVKTGWYDLGLKIISPLAAHLAGAFDDMFARADPQEQWLRRRFSTKREISAEEGKILLTGPGRGRNPFSRLLRKDLARARKVQIIAAYFLPTYRIRHQLMRAARRGGRVQLILAGKTDVFLSQLAGRSLFRRLLKAGVEIYEYQPQILHAKLIIIDSFVYAGSSNLDPRSLYINYELMLRFQNKKLVADARDLFARNLKHSQRIELEAWRKSRTWWSKLKQRWAYFLLLRVDPMFARWNFRWARRG